MTYKMVCRSSDSSHLGVCGERPVKHQTRVLLQLCDGGRSPARSSEETAGNRARLQVRPLVTLRTETILFPPPMWFDCVAAALSDSQ